MQKTPLLNEIKFLELRLHILKAQVQAEESSGDQLFSANLYGILKESEDITSEDIENVKIKLKELY